MHWTYRPAEIKDIDACYRLLPQEFVCDPVLRAQIPDIWRQWLLDGVMKITVIERHHGPRASRAVAFGLSVFTTTSFCREAETDLPPYVSAEIVRRWSVGQKVLLALPEIRRANSGDGLNLFILHIGWRQDLTDEELRLIKAKLLEAFFFAHQGYKVKTLLQEVFSTEEMERAVAFGAILKNDYAAYYRRHLGELPPPTRHPYVIGANHGETKEGTYLSPLFHYQPPRFFFKPGEQDLLLGAVIDQTDDELAQALHLSSSAIHKRWRAIYARVAEIDPSFFVQEDLDLAKSRRGLEKRRHLLSYLRHHPEELRPNLPPKS